MKGMKNIYIPTHNADGALSLVLGLIMCQLNDETINKIVLIGDHEFYTPFFSKLSPKEKIIFLDHELENESKNTLLELSQNDENNIYVFACSFIKPFDLDLENIIFQDTWCDSIEQVNSKDWDVYLPPLFKLSNSNIKEALHRSGLEFIESSLAYKIAPTGTQCRINNLKGN
jgi:hypothetical protein